MKIKKIISKIFVAFILAIVLFVVISILPIPENYKLLTVLSGSMEPAIKTGSVVVIKPSPLDSEHLTGQAGDYKIGDIITFGEMTKTKTPTTHRIIDTEIISGEVYYITKGDANNAEDSNKISESKVIGKVLFSVPYAGYAVAAAKKPIGFFLLVIIPCGIIIGEEINKIRKELKIKKLKN